MYHNGPNDPKGKESHSTLHFYAKLAFDVVNQDTHMGIEGIPWIRSLHEEAATAV